MTSLFVVIDVSLLIDMFVMVDVSVTVDLFVSNETLVLFVLLTRMCFFNCMYNILKKC